MTIRFLVSIVSIFVLLSCQSKPKINYSETLQDCLSNEDISQLNKATAQFEKKLIESYGSENSNKNYLLYLEDFSIMNLNPNFMLDTDSRKTLDDLKASGTFDKIWISFSELNKNEDQNTESLVIEFEPKKNNTNNEIPKIDIITINPTGDFLKCISKNTIHESLREVLKVQTQGASLSFGLTSKVVANTMTTEDLNNNLNKVLIAMIFYYEMIHLTNQNL